MSRPTLREVRKLATALDLEGFWWLHADRRDIRALTVEPWPAERKARWKAAARAIYPWRRITLRGPRTLVSPLMDRHAGRNIVGQEVKP